MLNYDRGAQVVLDCIQAHLDAQLVWFHWILNSLLEMSPAVAILPNVLLDGSVWPEGRRIEYQAFPGGTAGWYQNFSHVQKSGAEFGHFLSEVLANADEENAPSVREWHVAKVIVDRGRETLRGLGVDPDKLLKQVGILSGRLDLSDEDKAKTWCICDTNVFMHSTILDDMKWPAKMGYKPAVLVIPTTVLRELDRLKFDSLQPKKAERAKKAVRKLCKRMLEEETQASGPVELGPGLELLVQHMEPRAYANGLDPSVDDDRIIAAAMEFRWTHPGTHVAVLSADSLVRVKAKAWGLEQKGIPAEFMGPVVSLGKQSQPA